MPLARAEKRQDLLENLLLDFGEKDVELSDATDPVGRVLFQVLNKQLAVLTYLSLNVRDLIMLLNRENPDGRAPDGQIQVIGQRVTPPIEDEGQEVEGAKTAVTPPGEEDKENQ